MDAATADGHGRLCSVEGCGRAHYAKGRCQMHWRRVRKYGAPRLPVGWTPRGEPLRFLTEVALNHQGDGCLPWPFATNSDGYGRVWVDGHSVGAHRHLCTLAHGEPPSVDDEAAHSCGNRGCISPHHLRWATHVDNAMDTIEHGTVTRGVGSPRATLSDEQIRQIRDLRGKLPQREIAAMFGIAGPTVSKIQLRHRWAHVQ